MNINELRQTVESFFDTEWNLIEPGVPVAYDNTTFTPPDEDYWLRFSLLPTNVDRLSLGQNGCYEQKGLLSISVLTPLQSGMFRANELVDEVINIFNKANIGISFYDSTLSEVGQTEQRLIQTNIFIDYSVKV